MRVEITSDDDGDGLALTSLYQWLDLDDALKHSVELAPRRNPVPGEQGAVIDAIIAITNTATGFGSLAVSYATWRDAHRRKERVTFDTGANKATVVDGSETALQQLNDLAIEHEPAVEEE